MSSATSTIPDHRPSYGAATIAAGLVFVLYLLTIGPSTAMWDTSEYIAAAYIMGLPHPPGNPLFVLLGRFFTILPLGGDPAMRVNILAALCSSVAAGMWFLITERVLSNWLPERWQRLAGGALAALIGATAFTVWSQSVVNEKVYTVSLAGLAIIAWLTVRWCDNPEGPKADRILVLIAYLLGLGYANHMAGMMPAPAAALAVLIRRPQTVVRWKLILACVGALLLGLTPFATQPIRSAYFPAINEGETTGCRTEFAWSCTFTEKTWDAFKYNFNREQYGKPSLSERQAPYVTGQIGMWWTYFRWQWVRDPYLQHQMLQAVMAALYLVLGLFGAWVHWKRDRQSFWFFGPLMLTLTLVLIYYLNFKYGYSQSPGLGDTVDREVRDRDYFYLWSYSAWGVWAALGMVFVWESLAALVGTTAVRIGKAVSEMPSRRGWVLASPLLALAFIPLFANWSPASRRGDTTTADFAADLLNSVEPYGIIVTVGDNDTFPLWYAQEVEGIRQDVVIANTSLLNTDWYVRQIIRSPIRPYDVANGPALYRTREWPKPTRPPLQMTLDQADSIPLAVQDPDSERFEVGNIRTVIPPRVYTKADIAVLRMIHDNPDRPVYFSRTSGTYALELGLGPWMLTQGLARKLVHNVPMASRDTVLVPGEGFVDLPTSVTLWDSVFKGPQAMIRKNGWPDKSSIGIPALYISTGFYLYDALTQKGDSAQARSILRETQQVAKATRLGNYLDFGEPLPLESTLDQPQAAPVPGSGGGAAPPSGGGSRDTGGGTTP